MIEESASPQLLSFDSDLLPSIERLERYRDLYAAGAEVTETGPALRAAFQGWRLDHAILYDRHLNDIGHVRAEAKLDHYRLTHWTVTLVLEGWIAFDLGEGFQQIRPGEVLFVNTSAAGRNDAREAHIATLSIAEDRLVEIMGPLGRLHGRILSIRDARLYADFVRSLLNTLPTLHRASLPALTSTLGMILRAALDVSGRTRRSISSTQQALRLSEFRTMVESRLSDASFGTDSAIEASGLSRATLYRLLHAHGGLAAFIQHLRLDQLRRCLSDSKEERGFAELAHDTGFQDESHASRAFIARYGVRPTVYRAAVTQEEPDERFRAWQQDLR